MVQDMKDDKDAFIKSAKKALATRTEIPSVVTIQKRKPSQDVGDLEEQASGTKKNKKVKK